MFGVGACLREVTMLYDTRVQRSRLSLSKEYWCHLAPPNVAFFDAASHFNARTVYTGIAAQSVNVFATSWMTHTVT